ncbi:ANTR protein, partial [Geococcyx californianus]|nr:ANTR protein [Geococcyx californianus]
MKVKVCIGFVLTMVATTCLCRPAAKVPGAAGALVRRDWPESLSQEQKHLISRYLPHVFTAELGDHKDYAHRAEGMEALHELYYPDWLDFGRRSAEDAVDAA